MGRSVRRRRKGITALEVAIVVIVLALLAGLVMMFLVSGVGTAREAGRRSVCNSEIRMVGLATLNFESGRNRFPGYIEQVNADDDREIPWLVLLMPYLEKNEIYDAWIANKPNATQEPVKMLRCPSSAPGKIVGDFNSFTCNAGLIIKNPSGSNATYEDDNLPANGIFVDLRPRDEKPMVVKSKDLFDGQSYTMLIAENLLAGGWGDVSPVATPGAAESKVKLTTAFCWFDTNSPSAEMRINGKSRSAKKLTPELLRPSSIHPLGANTGFADGHTQFIRETIDYRVYKQLMTPKNKESSNSDKDYLLKEDDYE